MFDTSEYPFMIDTLKMPIDVNTQLNDIDPLTTSIITNGKKPEIISNKT